MTRRFLIFSFAAGLLALGGLNARAGLIQLPTDLGTGPSGLGTTGNYAIVDNLEFSNFSYTATNVIPGGPVPPPPAAASVTVSALTSNPGEAGITFTSGFVAPAGATYDYAISYKMTALAGTTISDASLIVTAGNFGGNGAVSVGETLSTGGTGTHLEATIGSPVAGPVSFAPQTSITVTKDITVVGGNEGATVSVINQKKKKKSKEREELKSGNPT